jgi:outer membrane receptor protein involved in Fe transport
MKNCCLAFLLCFLMAVPGRGHSISIRGVVYDQGTNTPLAGARVQLIQTSRVTATDHLGIYTFADLLVGKYEVLVSYLGYEHSRFLVEVTNKVPAEVTTHLQAGTLELAEVSVDARPDKPLNLIPAVDLQVRPLQNSQEVLRLIPGLFTAQHAGGGKAEQLLLRGFDVDHGTDLNLSVDGMPVNMVSHAHGQGYADLHFLIPETILEVDFGQGPYQADKGNFATAGYAAFKTRRALEKNQLKVEGGSFNTFRGVGLVNLLGKQARQNGQQAYVATEYLFSRGYFEAPQHLKRLNLFSQYQGVWKGNTIVHGSLAAFRSTWDASGQIPERAVAAGTIGRFGAIDATEGGRTARYHGNITLEKSFRQNAYLRHQLYCIRYDFRLYSNFTFFLHDPVNGDQVRQQEGRNLYGYHSTYHRESSFLGRPLRMEAGLGMRYDQINGSELSRTKARSTLAPVKRGNMRELDAFAFLKETWSITPKLNLNAALRFDQLFFNYQSLLPGDILHGKTQAARERLSPKINVSYAASPRLQLYLSMGQGFHSNDSRVSASRRQESLPAAQGLDVGMTVKPANRLLVQAALWWLDLKQELVYVGDEGIVAASGATRRYGLDLSLRAQLANYFFVDTDLNLAHPRFREGGAYIPLAPTLTSTGGVSYRPSEKLKGSVRYRYLGPRPANEDYSLSAAGYLLADATVGYTLKRMELKLTAENLFNRAWKEAQFETESRLAGESQPVTEIHFTPGSPFALRLGGVYIF